MLPIGGEGSYALVCLFVKTLARNLGPPHCFSHGWALNLATQYASRATAMAKCWLKSSCPLRQRADSAKEGEPRRNTKQGWASLSVGNLLNSWGRRGSAAGTPLGVRVVGDGQGCDIALAAIALDPASADPLSEAEILSSEPCG